MESRNRLVQNGRQIPDGWIPVSDPDNLSPDSYDEARYDHYDAPLNYKPSHPTPPEERHNNGRQPIASAQQKPNNMLGQAPQPAIRCSPPLNYSNTEPDFQWSSNTSRFQSPQNPIDQSLNAMNGQPFPRFASNEDYLPSNRCKTPSTRNIAVSGPPKVPRLSSGFMSSNISQSKEISRSKHATMPLFVPKASHDRQSALTDARLTRQRGSNISHFRQPMRDGTIDPHLVFSPEHSNSKPTAIPSWQRYPESRRPESSMVERATLHGVKPYYESTHTSRPETFGQRASPLSSPLSSASARYSPTTDARGLPPQPTVHRGTNNPASANATMMANVCRPETYRGGPSSQRIPANASTPGRGGDLRQSPVLGKRSRREHGQTGDRNTMLARPAKIQRSEQSMHPASMQTAPRLNSQTSSPRVDGREGISRPLGDQPSSRPGSTSYPKYQTIPGSATTGNLTISQAISAEKLDGSSEPFADPRNPAVADYIDTWYRDWMQGLRPFRGTHVSNHGRTLPSGYQTSRPGVPVAARSWEQNAYNPEDPGMRLDFTPLTQVDYDDLLVPYYKMRNSPQPI